MQTKVVLKSVSPVGKPLPTPQGQVQGTPQYSAVTAVFQSQDFPADGKAPDDYVHLPALVPFPVMIGWEEAKNLRIGGEYILTLKSVES